MWYFSGTVALFWLISDSGTINVIACLRTIKLQDVRKVVFCVENFSRLVEIIQIHSRRLSVSSVAQSCPTLCDPVDCSMPGLPVHHQLPELTQTHVHQVGDAIQPSHPHLIISSRALLLLPSIFPSIRVFSNESVLCIRWPKYWSIRPSNEYSGLISFRMDWMDLLAVQGTLKSLLQHHRRLQNL